MGDWLPGPGAALRMPQNLEDMEKRLALGRAHSENVCSHQQGSRSVAGVFGLLSSISFVQ